MFLAIIALSIIFGIAANARKNSAKASGISAKASETMPLVEQQQQRSAALLDRWEKVFDRVEAILTRWVNSSNPPGPDQH